MVFQEDGGVTGTRAQFSTQASGAEPWLQAGWELWGTRSRVGALGSWEWAGDFAPLRRAGSRRRKQRGFTWARGVSMYPTAACLTPLFPGKPSLTPAFPGPFSLEMTARDALSWLFPGRAFAVPPCAARPHPAAPSSGSPALPARPRPQENLFHTRPLLRAQHPSQLERDGVLAAEDVRAGTGAGCFFCLCFLSCSSLCLNPDLITP